MMPAQGNGRHERACPACGEICNKDARRCGGCGTHLDHGNPKPVHSANCAWTSGMDSCKFPGTSSTATDGSGPWYCRWHKDAKSSQYGEAITEMSKQWAAGTLPDKELGSQTGLMRPVYPRDDGMDKLQAEAKEWCKAQGILTVKACKERMKGFRLSLKMVK